MSDHLTFDFCRAVSISASDGAPDVFGSMKSENVWQLDPESDCTLLRLGCEDEDLLKESRGHKSTIDTGGEGAWKPVITCWVHLELMCIFPTM